MPLKRCRLQHSTRNKKGFPFSAQIWRCLRYIVPVGLKIRIDPFPGVVWAEVEGCAHNPWRLSSVHRDGINTQKFVCLHAVPIHLFASHHLFFPALPPLAFFLCLTLVNPPPHHKTPQSSCITRHVNPLFGLSPVFPSLLPSPCLLYFHPVCLHSPSFRVITWHLHCKVPCTALSSSAGDWASFPRQISARGREREREREKRGIAAGCDAIPPYRVHEQWPGSFVASKLSGLKHEKCFKFPHVNSRLHYYHNAGVAIGRRECLPSVPEMNCGCGLLWAFCPHGF